MDESGCFTHVSYSEYLMQNEASNVVLNISETQDQGDNEAIGIAAGGPNDNNDSSGDNYDCSSSVVSTLSVGSSINDNNESKSANGSGSISVTEPPTDDPIYSVGSSINDNNESNSANGSGSISVTEPPTDDPITPTLDNNNSDIDSDDIDSDLRPWYEASKILDLFLQM